MAHCISLPGEDQTTPHAELCTTYVAICDGESPQNLVCDHHNHVLALREWNSTGKPSFLKYDTPNLDLWRKVHSAVCSREPVQRGRDKLGSQHASEQRTTSLQRRSNSVGATTPQTSLPNWVVSCTTAFLRLSCAPKVPLRRRNTGPFGLGMQPAYSMIAASTGATTRQFQTLKQRWPRRAARSCT